MHEGLPPLYPAELDQLDHAPGTAARINDKVDSIGLDVWIASNCGDSENKYYIVT